MRIVITGGNGDWASSFASKYGDIHEIFRPGKAELDVTCVDSVDNYFQERPFDVLINAAGSIHSKRVTESIPMNWINDIKVNLIGAYLTSRAVLIKNPKAIVINISSTAAFNAYPDWSSYCSAKSGVVTLTKCLSNDGFNAFCLCPGGFDTKFRKNFNLDNSRLMPCDAVSDHVEKIIKGGYSSGDVVVFRKDFLELNPSWSVS